MNVAYNNSLNHTYIDKNLRPQPVLKRPPAGGQRLQKLAGGAGAGAGAEAEAGAGAGAGATADH